MQASLGQSDAYRIALRHRRRIAQRLPCRILRNRVSSLQYSQRRQGVERSCREREPFSRVLKLTFHQSITSRRRCVKSRPRARQTRLHFIKSMRQRLFLNSRAKVDDLVSRQAHQLPAKIFERRADLILTRRDDLRSSRRRGRAKVSNKISNSEISFVTHSRDHGNRRLANRTSDFLLIECPQILGRTTATSDDQNVNEIRGALFVQRAFMILIDEPDGARDVRTSRVALHARRRK